MKNGANRPRVAVFFGGVSGEHSISCSTAAGVLNAIDRTVFDVIPIGIRRDGTWVQVPDDSSALAGGRADVGTVARDKTPVILHENRLIKLAVNGLVDLGQIDVLLPLLHGPFGEDGTVQGLFELSGVPYAGAGVLASALAMDKHFTKVALQAAGVPVAKHVLVTEAGWRTRREVILDECAQFGLPLFVKPARAGSSLGVTKVTELEDLPQAIEAARKHDPKVLVEGAIEGREIECAVLAGRSGGGPRVAPLGEVVATASSDDFYDFEAKYFGSEGFSIECPAVLSDGITARVHATAVEAFEAIDAEGFARVDFFVTPAGDVIVNEINTLPGFTPHSMFPVMWAEAGLTYTELVTEILQLALERPIGLR